MRDMETEAFNCGNIMIFRDFEDNYKQENRKMSKLQENRLKKLNGLLMEQGFSGQSRSMLDRAAAQRAQMSKQLAKAPTAKSVPNRLKNLADAFVKNMEGYVSADNLKTVIRGLKLINDSNEYKVVDALFKKDYGKNLRDAIDDVLILTGQGYAGEQKRIAKGLIDSIKRSVTLDVPDGVADGPADPQSRGLQATRPPAKAAPKGQGQRLVRDPVTGEMVPLAPDAQVAPRGASKATSKGPRKYRKCTGILRMGCGGDNIEVLQRKLHNVLKLKSNVDSFADKKFGPGTKRAVKAFQRAAKLKVDGVAGENTLKALDAAVAGKLGIATPKGPAGDIDRLAKPGSEIAGIFDQKALENNITRDLSRADKREYRKIKRQVMNMVLRDLGSDNRKDYLTA